MEYFLIVSAFFVTLLATFFKTKHTDGRITCAGYGFILLSVLIVLSSIVNTREKKVHDKELLRVANRAFINELIIIKASMLNYRRYSACILNRALQDGRPLDENRYRKLSFIDDYIDSEQHDFRKDGGCQDPAILRNHKVVWSDRERRLELLLNRYSQTVAPYSQYLSSELIANIGTLSNPDTTIDDFNDVEALVRPLSEIFCKDSKYSLCMAFQ